MPFRSKRQALGQHFLKDQKQALLIVQNAIEEAQKKNCKSLLEIGPGTGALTYLLMERLPPQMKFILCEKDANLGAHWKNRFAKSPPPLEARLEMGDFLDLPESRWLDPNCLPLAVVSNLPYSAATAILQRLARHPKEIPVLVLMFQAEVGQKLRAEPGSSHRGSLSVWIQNQWEIKRLSILPPWAFSPPPKVNSEVLLFQAREVPLLPQTTSPDAAALLEKLLKTAFAHRRKMLRSGLPSTGAWKKALEISGVNPTKRPEALDWADWQNWFRALLP